MNWKYWIYAIPAIFLFCLAGQTQILRGAGASFPFPIYSQWAYEYEKMTATRIHYQSIGSGGGIAQIKAKNVDFGASDAPLKHPELEKFGLIQFPMIVGGVVPVINLRGVKAGEVRISQDVLVDIFLGNIEEWNDDAIKSLNPDIHLPNQPITLVHRADGSGTTWIFTNYLSKISLDWRTRIGFGKAVEWPAGVGGKGNEGVAAYVQRVNGAIGYVEFTYALKNRLSYVLLENKEGHYVSPDIENFQAACASADWQHAPGYYMVLTDQPGAKSWPITGASYILIYKQQKNPKKAKAILDFFDWCYTSGDDLAKKLHYVPIPPNVVKLVEETWRKTVSVGNQTVWQ